MISMVSAVYNKAKLLERVLASVLLQKHKCDWEIVLINDGSTDNIMEIFDFYRHKMSLRMFNTFRPGYLSPAWPTNCAVKKAKGEYILLGSPDVIHYGDTFDFMHLLLEKQDILVGATIYDLTALDNKWLKNHNIWRNYLSQLKRFNKRRQLLGPNENAKYRKGYFWIGGCRKESFLRVGGMDESFIYPGAEDKEFISRCNAFGIKPECVWRISKNDPIKGYHQYHKRDWLHSSYKEKLQRTHEQYAESLQRLKTKLIPANYGKEWGILSEENEVK